MGIEFGEGVLFRRKPGQPKLAKLSSLWEEGIYLGHRAASGESVVGTSEGVWKTRTVQRKPVETRWDPENAKNVGGVPWKVSLDDPDADGPIPELAIPIFPGVAVGPSVLARESVPRRGYIKKEDFERHGYTPKCNGCKALLQGGIRQPHEEACRKRMEEHLRDTDCFKAAEKRGSEYVAKAVEAEDQREKRSRMADNVNDHNSENPGIPGGGSSKDGSTENEMDTDQNQKRKRDGDDDGDQDDGRDGTRRPVQGCPPEGNSVFVGKLEVNQEHEETWEDWANDMYYDDKTGKKLDAWRVKAAEDEELSFMEELGVGAEVGVEECWKMTGKAPISTKFVRVNKAMEDEEPDVRARLCGRDFKVKGEGEKVDLFAAMPPLESKKLLFRQAARTERKWHRGAWRRPKLLFIDVKKAHLNGKVPDNTFVYVQLPDGRCWRLRRWLYGMRPAASAWEADYTNKLESIGFQRGKSAPTVFYRAGTGCRCVTHGDDFTFLAFDDQIKIIIDDMKKWYHIKVRAILGGQPEDDQEVVILNRRLTWRHDIIEYEADKRHAEQIVEDMGIELESNGLEAPIERQSIPEGYDDGEEDLLGPREATQFRGVAARANYMSQDRIDTQYASKEISRYMSRPRISSWDKLKRLARYLVEHPRVVWKFDGADKISDGDYIDVFSDSDWAGDKISRRSTSGGVASISGGAIKHWSSTQGTIAMSSGEAEYYALVKSAAEGLGLQSLAKDLGYEMKVRIWVDSSSALAIVSRLGLGRVRHMEVKYLWAQEAHKNHRFCVRKVNGPKNPADVLTKPQSAVDMSEKMKTVGGTIVRRLRQA